jgi:rRNA maturation endonuclease Nob1
MVTLQMIMRVLDGNEIFHREPSSLAGETVPQKLAREIRALPARVGATIAVGAAMRVLS